MQRKTQRPVLGDARTKNNRAQSTTSIFTKRAQIARVSTRAAILIVLGAFTIIDRPRCGDQMVPLDPEHLGLERAAEGR